MVRIEMSPDEARMLRRILESNLSELRIDMAATNLEEFEETLRREEGLIEKVLQHLKSPDLSYPESMFGEYA